MASQRGYRFWLTFGLSGIIPLLWASDPPNPSHVVRNVLIVTLDTTRADVLSAYATDQVETPGLDRLSREGTVFEQATTTVPLTLPALVAGAIVNFTMNLTAFATPALLGGARARVRA